MLSYVVSRAPPPCTMPALAVSMEGNLECVNGRRMIKGIWATTQAHLRKGFKDIFELTYEGAPLGRQYDGGMGPLPPPNGRYKGFFNFTGLTNTTERMEDESDFYFTANSASSWNISGTAKNLFDTYAVTGLCSAAGRVTLWRVPLGRPVPLPAPAPAARTGPKAAAPGLGGGPSKKGGPKFGGSLQKKSKGGPMGIKTGGGGSMVARQPLPEPKVGMPSDISQACKTGLKSLIDNPTFVDLVFVDDEEGESEDLTSMMANLNAGKYATAGIFVRDLFQMVEREVKSMRKGDPSARNIVRSARAMVADLPGGAGLLKKYALTDGSKADSATGELGLGLAFERDIAIKLVQDMDRLFKVPNKDSKELTYAFCLNKLVLNNAASEKKTRRGDTTEVPLGCLKEELQKRLVTLVNEWSTYNSKKVEKVQPVVAETKQGVVPALEEENEMDGDVPMPDQTATSNVSNKRSRPEPTDGGETSSDDEEGDSSFRPSKLQRVGGFRRQEDAPDSSTGQKGDEPDTGAEEEKNEGDDNMVEDEPAAPEVRVIDVHAPLAVSTEISLDAWDEEGEEKDNEKEGTALDSEKSTEDASWEIARREKAARAQRELEREHDEKVMELARVKKEKERALKQQLEAQALERERQQAEQKAKEEARLKQEEHDRKIEASRTADKMRLENAEQEVHLDSVREDADLMEMMNSNV